MNEGTFYSSNWNLNLHIDWKEHVNAQNNILKFCLQISGHRNSSASLQHIQVSVALQIDPVNQTRGKRRPNQQKNPKTAFNSSTKFPEFGQLPSTSSWSGT